MPETAEKLAFLALGWLLGLMAPVIVDAIKRRRNIEEVKEALVVELHELQYRLVLKVYSLQAKLGTTDRALLTWMRPFVAKYEGLSRSESFLAFIDEALKLPEDKLAAFEKATGGNPAKGLMLKKYPTPVLDSNLGQLGFLGRKLQNLLLEIHSHLSIVNEDIDQYRVYFNLTFNEGLSSENRALVLDNIRLTYENIAIQASVIVDLISRMSEHEKRI